VATKRNNSPQDITPFVLAAGPFIMALATWFGYPGVPVIWFSFVVAAWLMQPPILTGKKDSYGYPAAANGAEERKLSRYQAAKALRTSLLLPVSDLLPGRPVRAAWISGLAVAGLDFLLPVIGNPHLTSSSGHAIDAAFAFVLVVALTGALRRAKGPDNPGIRFDTWRGYVAGHRIGAPLAGIAGALLGGAVAFGLLVLDARFGSSFGAKTLSATKTTHPGLVIASPSIVLLVFAVVGAWLMFLAAWSKSATAGFVEITNARAQWKYRWMSLKFDPTPALVDHQVLGNGAVIVDTFDAPAHLGAVEFIKTEPRLSPLVNAGERVALLSSPEEGPTGPVPGSRSAIRFRAVTWTVPYDVSSPDATAELAALWIQSGLAWVSHARGVPAEPLPAEIVAATSDNRNDDDTVDGDAPAVPVRQRLHAVTTALSEFWRHVKESSPTTSTLAAALADDNNAANPISEDATGDSHTMADDDVDTEEENDTHDDDVRQLWRTTWLYSDDTIGPQVFRDNALGELETALHASVLIDHRDGGTIYVGDLASESITDPTTERALLKVRTEDLWRKVWQSSVKSGANLPVPQIATHAERKLANGTVIHRMAFAINLGNDPLDYKYPGVEGKLKSALGLGRTSGASLAAVTGYPDLNNGGRPGDRHPQAIYVIWSFDPVPGTPKALAPSSPADQWILASIVNNAFSNLKMAHPEIVAVRCLTRPSAPAHAWEVQLRLYGAVTTGNVRAAAGKIADNLATPWVRVSDAPDGCVLYFGVVPDAESLASPADADLVASLDWEQAFLDAHVVGSVGSVPTLVATSHLPSNEAVHVLEFELPPGVDKAMIKTALSTLRAGTRNAYLNVLDSENGPAYVTIQASVENPLPPMVPFDFSAADRSLGMAFATGVDGEPVEFVPKQEVHLAIIGKSGSGKTVAAQALLYGAAIKGYEIYVIDPMKGAADFKFLEPYSRAMATTIHDGAATLKAIYADVERRKNLNAEYGTASIADLPDDVRPAPILVFIDEFTSLIVSEKVPRQPFDDPELEAERQQQLLISNDRMSIAYYTGKLAREARSAGVSLGLGTQKLMAASLEAVPGGGDLKSNLSRLLLGPTSQGERMSALRAFDQAPDPGETMPTGRGVWESSIRTGVLIQAWYAPATQLGEELAKRIDPLTAEQRLDITPFLSRGAERVGVFEPDDTPFDYGDDDKVIDLGEMSFSLDDLLTVSDEVDEESADAIVEQPAPWNIDWSAPSADVSSVDSDDDPFALPAAKPKLESRLVHNDDPFA
jgi:hypothetical protein